MPIPSHLVFSKLAVKSKASYQDLQIFFQSITESFEFLSIFLVLLQRV